ncbi:MAG: GNAT family N-acetyltransferase, partial [Rubrivivax sp.]|nr:GNAT family N-acetyltransferase [Rubrivivax sp.]
LAWPAQGVRISAQLHLQRFYAAYGFRPVGSDYLEDDIPHIQMLREG